MVVFFILLLVPMAMQHIVIGSTDIDYEKKNRRALTVFFVLLTILVACRHESVGTDTRNYVYFFERFSAMSWGEVGQDSLEYGYAYGGLAAHGGGAFSGKDPTKVDRSAAYMARAIARNVVGAWLAEECQVSISYAIGKAEPTAVEIDTFGTAKVDEDVIRLAVLDVFDLRPAAIMSLLHLRAPIYADTAAYGHFNGYKYSWENLDKTDELRKAVEKYAD